MITGSPHFRVSPAVLGPLGLEQVQDPALAILELVKNSWDADATRVAISVSQCADSERIAVLDNGHGMTRAEFEERWLVIGASHKRSRETSESGRPLIGEKGLGRLSSFALGESLSISSARPLEQAFHATVDWAALSRAPTLEDYGISVSDTKPRRGTRVEIGRLRVKWQAAHTEFLVTHAEFLASLPGQRFTIGLWVDGQRHALEHPVASVSRFAEASMEVEVLPDGSPRILACDIDGADQSKIVFRDLKAIERDQRLAGMRLSLKFFRRDEAVRRLSGVLGRNEVTSALERYQGIRVYRDGINVPPYGLNGDDWAGLEKQRTATGGPTMVPGNSQLIGEVRLSRHKHPHLIVTAGRSGFSDQAAVGAAAKYVRWAVRELGTARRAHQIGIRDDTVAVPPRIDSAKFPETQEPESVATNALAQIAQAQVVRDDPELRHSIADASKAVADAFDRHEQTLRLYAQLASTGIAATSFAHELRTEFDVISEALSELNRARQRPDKELLGLLNDSWKRLRAFAALFKVIPVKLRRQRRLLSSADLRGSLKAITGLAPPDKVAVDITVPSIEVRMVPAEFDSIALNLISNAVKAIAASSNREVGRMRVALNARGSDLEIDVADNGCGISTQVAKIMFEPLEGRFAEGTGMGLPIVKFIAERYKGSVTLVAPSSNDYVTQVLVRLRNVVEP